MDVVLDSLKSYLVSFRSLTPRDGFSQCPRGEVPKATLRFRDSLGLELSKAVVLRVTVYITQGHRLKSAKENTHCPLSSPGGIVWTAFNFPVKCDVNQGRPPESWCPGFLPWAGHVGAE